MNIHEIQSIVKMLNDNRIRLCCSAFVVTENIPDRVLLVRKGTAIFPGITVR